MTLPTRIKRSFKVKYVLVVGIVGTTMALAGYIVITNKTMLSMTDNTDRKEYLTLLLADETKVLHSMVDGLETQMRESKDSVLKVVSDVKGLQNEVNKAKESTDAISKLGSTIKDLQKEVSLLKSMVSEVAKTTPKKTPPSFCESVSQQQHVGYLKDISISRLKPFNIEVYRTNDIVSDNIRKSGYWDREKLLLLQDIVTDYSIKKGLSIDELTFVDIGSNIGWFTLIMAAMGLEVMAFEPMASNVNMLKRSLCTETNIQSGVGNKVNLFPFGLGPKEESCIIISHNINEGDGHTLCGKSESEIEVPRDYVIRGKIITKRLDDVASSEGKIIPLVKMDVEGYESHVVEGGRNFLLNSKIPYIITEFVPKWIRDKEGDPERMMTRFYDAGYKVLKNGSHLPRDQAMNMQQYPPAGDVMFQLVEN